MISLFFSAQEPEVVADAMLEEIVPSIAEMTTMRRVVPHWISKPVENAGTITTDKYMTLILKYTKVRLSM